MGMITCAPLYAAIDKEVNLYYLAGAVNVVRISLELTPKMARRIKEKTPCEDDDIFISSVTFMSVDQFCEDEQIVDISDTFDRDPIPADLHRLVVKRSRKAFRRITFLDPD